MTEEEMPLWRWQRWVEQRRIEREEPDEWTRAMWGRIYLAVYGDKIDNE